MDISAIGKVLPFRLSTAGKDGAGNVPPVAQDYVDISAPQLLSDEEADDVLDATIDMLAQDHMGALYAHGGLSCGRALSLVGL